MQVRADHGLGWVAILDAITAANALHQGFKVAHHGSSNADHDDIWSRMLQADAWAATTPFVSGRVKLPLRRDCQRILCRTSYAYLTAPPHAIKFRDRNRTVQKTVNEVARLAQFVPGKYGQVRLRKRVAESPDTPWSADLFGHALVMADYVAAA